MARLFHKLASAYISKTANDELLSCKPIISDLGLGAPVATAGSACND